MSDIPLYTKWRPLQITDIVGQKKIVSAIKKQAEKNKFHHAYLFAGQFGSGKTSIARIISALMTCEHKEGHLICGKCKSDVAIHGGYCVDVYEIDAASKRGIDDARKIRDTANYAPQELKRKIYIIDECLSGQTRINTDKGLLYIRDIVEKKIKANILSYNKITKNIEFKPITGWFKNSGKKTSVLGFEGEGRIYPSDGHLISTPEGFKKVEEINIGDLVHRYGTILSYDQKQLIYGSLLGDASFRKNEIRKPKGRGTNARLTFVQGKKQKKYIELKHLLMSNVTDTPPKASYHIGWKNQPPIKTFRFNTKCSSQFNEIYNNVIANNKKTISKKWLNNVDWMGIAFWFCDDGSLQKHKNKNQDGNSITFHTQGFSYKENKTLQNWLKKKGIKCSILSEQKNNKNLYRISLDKDGSNKLLNNIWKYVPECMNYKLHGFYKDEPKYKYCEEDRRTEIVTEKVTFKKPFRFEKITYDLEVKDNHNYFASGTLVHNCHQLTPEAWNALLKLIEEPPSYVTFIFCTTDHRKVPSTITSRCQCFVFNQISTQEMFDHLKMIAKKEKIEIVDNVLVNIAKISHGSMRDAINHLEQIAMAKDNKVGEKEANEYFGIPDETITYEIVNLMVAQDASGLLEKVNVLLQSGIDAKTILNDISHILRNIFVCKICGKDSELLDVLDVERKAIAEIAEKVNRNGLIKTASALSRIEKEINVNINERWILEAALINCLILLKNDVPNTK